MAVRIGGESPHTPRPMRGLLRPLQQAAKGMTIQQRFMETISANIANAETTRTAEGGPYRRQVAVTDGQTTRIVEESTQGRLVYDPAHPDADERGYVRMPNVDTEREMVDLMIARRLHEANASVFQAAKSMLRRAMEI